MRIGWLACVAMVSGCGDDDCCKVDDAGTPDVSIAPGERVEVAWVPVTVNHDIDMLFVIDDSPSMLDKQTRLKNAFPTFVSVLSALPDGLPNLHLGVVSTDVGTKGADDATAGPMIGVGAGSCTGIGKGGTLLTNASPLISGNFINDIRNTDGSRTKNYTGTLTEAFSAIASVGANGCGFEQPVHAAKRALDNNPANAGFLRPNAGLAVIILSDEDDCSISHSTLYGTDTTTLGPLNSFRCTRFGVTCDQGGTTTTEMNQVGVKSGCHSNEASPYTMPIAAAASWFAALKQNASQVMFAAMTGPTSPFAVELRAPPGSSDAVAALAHSCMYSGAVGNEFGDPGVRIAGLVGAFARSSLSDVCGDMSTALTTIANQVRGMVGDTCLSRPITMPPDCVATDQTSTGTTTVPACSATVTTDCYQLINDPAGCTSEPHLRVLVERSSVPPPDLVLTVRCYVP